MVRCSIPCFTDYLLNYTILQFSEAIVTTNLIKSKPYETDAAYYFIKDNFKVLDISKKALKTFVVQLASDNVDEIVKSIKLVYDSTQQQVNKFNLNAGCNMGWTQRRFGSWLIKNKKLVQLVKGVVQQIQKEDLKIQLSVKIRLLNDKVQCINLYSDLLNILDQIPQNFDKLLIVHMRYIDDDRKQTNIQVDFTQQIIKSLETKYQNRIMYNGDLTTIDQIQQFILELNKNQIQCSNESIMRSRGSMSLPNVQNVQENQQINYINNVLYNILDIFEKQYQIQNLQDIRPIQDDKFLDQDVFQHLQKILQNDVKQLMTFILKEFTIQFPQQKKYIRQCTQKVCTEGVFEFKRFVVENQKFQ